MPLWVFMISQMPAATMAVAVIQKSSLFTGVSSPYLCSRTLSIYDFP
jgi:hypothetical protein